ncbi:MAG: hypothetical protein GY926_08930, partial [bacterium]|nr:hypothetical protein [bacterium]
AARALLTIFMIAVDTMPVIAKAIGGYSTYDRALQRRIESDERKFEVSTNTAEWTNRVENNWTYFLVASMDELRRSELEQWRQARLNDLSKRDISGLLSQDKIISLRGGGGGSDDPAAPGDKSHPAERRVSPERQKDRNLSATHRKDRRTTGDPRNHVDDVNKRQ